MERSRPTGLRAFLPYLRGQGVRLAVVAVITILQTAAVLSQPLIMRLAIDAIAMSRPAARLVAALIGLLVAVALLNAVRGYLLQLAGEQLVLTMRRALAGHLLRLPLAEYDQRRTGDLLSRVGADTTSLRSVVTGGLLDLASGVVMVAGAAVIMFLLDPVLFAVMCAGLATGFSVATLATRRLRVLSERVQDRLGELTATVERALSAIRTVRAARAEGRESAQIDRHAWAAYRAGERVARWKALVGPVATTASQGAFLLVLGIGGARVASGAITVGELVAFVLFLFFLIMPLGQAIGAYAQLQTGLGALARVEAILAIPPEDHADKAAEILDRPEPARGRPAAVEFRKVSFGYNGTGPILREVSFTAPSGSRTALVGPSGAGKTTTLTLVERFYDVSGGSVSVNGVDVRDMPRDVLRSQLCYVEQEAPVLAGTIRDNLLIAAPTATDEEIHRTLAAVGLTGLVSRTPLGLHAPVGDSGVLLSGGERQRLAIARALLAQSPVLLLDEPTSHLDARSEQGFRRALEAIPGDRTLLIVAHRLSTVIDADQIVVLDRGEVVAVGDHRSLLHNSPLYHELAANQLASSEPN